MKKNKHWITDILVDLIVSVFIAAAVIFHSQWLIYLVTGYTAFILFAKLLVLFSGQVQAITAKSSSAAPDWIYHLLYLFNALILFLFGWYLTALAWIVIWGLSVYNKT